MTPFLLANTISLYSFFGFFTFAQRLCTAVSHEYPEIASSSKSALRLPLIRET